MKSADSPVRRASFCAIALRSASVSVLPFSQRRHVLAERERARLVDRLLESFGCRSAGSFL